MPHVVLLATLLLGAPAGETESSGPARVPRVDTTLTLASHPTVVGFFSVPEEAFTEQPGLPQVLADFHDFLVDARPQLRALMVVVHEAYGRPIRLRTPGSEWELPIGSGLPVGYYLWSPGRPTYVCRGVRVAVALVELVREYLEGEASPGAALSRCERADR